MRITAISDTHTKHNRITEDLPGGDLLLCSGDISSMGYIEEIKNFLAWFEQQNYDKKIFIAGNHDWGFQDYPDSMPEILMEYDVVYLQDDLYVPEGLIQSAEDFNKATKIWGSPWQPEFCGWAFNLPRNGQELELVWDKILPDTDILLTHGPAWGHLDVIKGRNEHLGCELLAARIEKIKPKIHIFGHIHEGAGVSYSDECLDTVFINASYVDRSYVPKHEPTVINYRRTSD